MPAQAGSQRNYLSTRRSPELYCQSRVLVATDHSRHDNSKSSLRSLPHGRRRPVDKWQDRLCPAAFFPANPAAMACRARSRVLVRAASLRLVIGRSKLSWDRALQFESARHLLQELPRPESDPPGSIEKSFAGSEVPIHVPPPHSPASASIQSRPLVRPCHSEPAPPTHKPSGSPRAKL